MRARRTILSADTVSLLAAVDPLLVSIGDVRGFAFTLGLSTILDLVVVFFFTKPLITPADPAPDLLHQSRGAACSGVDRPTGGPRSAEGRPCDAAGTATTRRSDAAVPRSAPSQLYAGESRYDFIGRRKLVVRPVADR